MTKLAGLRVIALAAITASTAGSATASESTNTYASAAEVRLVPSASGVLGAWLVCGPFRAQKPALDRAPDGVDEAALAPSLGAVVGGERTFGGKKKPPARWQLASTDNTQSNFGPSGDRPLDMKAALDAGSLADVVAYAAGLLSVERAGRYYLLLGIDDGVRVSVDGRNVYARDDARPVREDDDVIALDLTEGAHTIILKLHQHGGAWAMRARFVDSSLQAPAGTYLRLPGTGADDARALAAKMSWLSVDRAFDAASDPPRYRPTVTVRFPEGAPRGVPLPVSAKLVVEGHDEPLFDLQAGGVAAAANGISDLSIALPPISWNGSATLDVTVAGRTVRSPFVSRPLTERALVHTTRVLANVDEHAAWLTPGSLDSVRFLTQRLSGLVARGDTDAEAQAGEAGELENLASSLEHDANPYDGKVGPMRRAIASEIDGEPTEFGLYIPASYKQGSTRKFPLVVGLHGLNGYAMAMMRWLFGGDDPNHDQVWEDRHVGTLPRIDAFVVTPSAHGNALYRELGETDVIDVVDWVKRTYPIDAARVTITGPSMGGIGAAAIPLHTPNVFAAAAPLCGYHSTFLRSDVGGRPIRPWETFLAEERSNAFWAENGEGLPLFIVHGKQDLPEANSGVLIDRYRELGYSVTHEHPNKGHNVWQETYDGLKGINWLLGHARDLHPSHVRFKTTRTRWNKSAWIAIDELSAVARWGEIDAHVTRKRNVFAKTRGIDAITFARDPALLDPNARVEIAVDAQTLLFEPNEDLRIHKEHGTWRKGPSVHDAPYKHGTVTGPIRDVFHGPVLFVYASDTEDARANETVARSIARIRAGVRVAYPIMSDAEFFAKSEALANDRSLVLVGRQNRVLEAFEQLAALPIKVSSGAVTIGTERITGASLGAAFIHPNPVRPDRYVVVIAGADMPGTLRALSLPDLLPDFVVWDDRMARSRGQTLLNTGAVRAGGFFTKEWALPTSFTDPFMKSSQQP
ncbi:MAG: alpha/beta hydrolase-fold protein [Polyangiaceae bacterium]|nr:alpha/beta hydrolase-fold protein [Polyangiaceae bacterium]